MQFEKGIWQEAWDVYLLNWKSVAIAMAAAIVHDLATEYLGGTGSSRTIVDLIIWSMVAISMHGTILLNEVNYGSNAQLLMPFAWRSVVLVLLSIAPFLVAVFYGHITSLEALVLAGLAALVVFGLLGTWLPAVVINGDRRVSSAFARGRRTFLYTVPRLFFGPGIVQTILLAGLILLPIHGVLAGEVFGATGLSLIDLISLPVIYALRGFTVAILAVVLSRAYLMAEQTSG